MGGDKSPNLQSGQKQGFNPRPRMGGDYYRSGRRKIKRCFNPRPRMGGDYLTYSDLDIEIVSIHAPAWGAT